MKIYNNIKYIHIPIIGKYNVGKSTIFNKLIKKKISITSKKKNTTQKKIIGIDKEKNIQYIYIDTPGLNKYQNIKIFILKIINFIKNYFKINIINLIIIVIDKKLNDQENELLNKLELFKIPLLLIINKIDKIKNKLTLLPYINNIIKKNKYIHTILPISKKNFSKKIDYIKNTCINFFLTKNKNFFFLNFTTNYSKNFIFSEIIREKILRLTGDEIPYNTFIKIKNIYLEKKKTSIDCILIVKKKQYINIIKGKNNNKINKIINLSKIDIKKYLNKKNKIYINYRFICKK